MEISAFQLFDQLVNPVFVASSQGKLLFVNDSLRKLLDTNKALQLREYLDEVQSISRQLAISAVKNGTIEAALDHATDHKWISWNVSFSEDGNLIGVGTDITLKRKKEAEQLIKSRQLNEVQQDLISSIQYAQRIQEAVLPDITRLNKYFQGAFVFYQPRDIVSGDFYWFARKDDYLLAAVADCTGHGVPGAMMSMMGYSFLDSIVRKRNLIDCGEILSEIDNEIQVVLNQGENGARDGMDISLVRIHLHTLEMQFAGAMRNGYILRDGELTELKASKYPLGFFDHVEKKFDNTGMQLQANDRIFLFTDGITDQFGGDNDKKLNKKRFKEVLQLLGDLTSEEQAQYLEYVFLNWKQQTLQTDDVAVLGITI